MISIHTPTQGVTFYNYTITYTANISIHTPTQGVTSLTLLFIMHVIDFNPHSHAGSDFNALYVIVGVLISIHTPTQGVTYYVSVFYFPHFISIHTPTQGVTQRPYYITAWTPMISIHTPTQGVTKMSRRTTQSITTFQSTLPRRE